MLPDSMAVACPTAYLGHGMHSKSQSSCSGTEFGKNLERRRSATRERIMAPMHGRRMQSRYLKQRLQYRSPSQV